MKNIVIIFGGKSCEHDISVITALSIYPKIIDKYNILPVYIYCSKFYICKKTVKISNILNFSKKCFKEVYFSNGYLNFVCGKRRVKVDCVLNCCHGSYGENGALSGVFEIADIPYTSSGVYESSLFMDKVLTKYFLERTELPFLDYRICNDKSDLLRAAELGYPLIVKPARQGSSIGIRIVNDKTELEAAFDEAYAFDDKIIVEKALNKFVELNCAAFKYNGKIIVSDVEKIENLGAFFDFNAKYKENKTMRQLPADIGDELTSEIKSITSRIYELASLKGVVRIDFLFSENGRLYVNEVNTVPGSLAFYLFKKLNINIADLVEYIIEEGIRVHAQQNKLVRHFDNNVLAYVNESKMDLAEK